MNTVSISIPRKCLQLLCALAIMSSLVGCFAVRSDVRGRFSGPYVENTGAREVNVAFRVRHAKQLHGFDTVPKLEVGPAHKRDTTTAKAAAETYFFFESMLPNIGIPKDFADVFRGTVKELSNVRNYSATTELPEGFVSAEEEDVPLEKVDYSMEVAFLRESSYGGHWAFGLTHICTGALVPAWVSFEYSVAVNVYDADEKLLGQYERQADLSVWYQALFFLVHPFLPVLREEEEIYFEFLTDIFRQIESEKVLR